MNKSQIACTLDAWTLETWPIDDSFNHQFSTFRCKSWRHAGECRCWKGQQDFTRIKAALESRENWLHVVLTYPFNEEVDLYALFKASLAHWSKLRKRLSWRDDKLLYIQVWEVTRKGCPHCHMAVSSKWLWRESWTDPVTNFERCIQAHAVACGFGERGWCERIKSGAGMAKYLNKLEDELTGGGKDYQVPIDAPPHYRRLRASRGLLPPVEKNPDITGALRFHRVDGEDLEEEIARRLAAQKRGRQG